MIVDVNVMFVSLQGLEGSWCVIARQQRALWDWWKNLSIHLSPRKCLKVNVSF